MEAMTRLLTVGELARRIGCPVHRVEYLIRSRHLRPAARSGNARVFCLDHLRLIEAEIRRLDAERGNRHE